MSHIRFCSATDIHIIPMRRPTMQWSYFKLAAIMVLVVIVSTGCTPSVDISTGTRSIDETPLEDYTGAKKMSDALDPRWMAVSQGWNDEVRRAFWFTPQGSRLMPYEWFLHLELPNSLEKFKDSMSRFGYIDGPKDNIWNPDGLPLGFANSPDPDGGHGYGGFVGPTCAACHANLITYKGKALFIDGAPSLTDLQGLNEAIVEAMDKTINDEAKFERFVKAVLGSDLDTETKNELRSKFQEHKKDLAIRNELNYKGLTDGQHYGYGRLDAVGALFNQAAVTSAKAPENIVIADAPVSFPHLWGTPQSDVVQWNGFATNDNIILGFFGAGPLGRNVGEVTGVYGAIEVNPASQLPEDKAALAKEKNEVATLVVKSDESPTGWGYRSSILTKNLGALEHWIKMLRSPKWPENILGPINQDMVREGRKIYMGDYKKETGTKCVGCHALVPREKEMDPYYAELIEQSEIGTDPKMAENFLLARNPKTNKPWSSGLLEGTKANILFGDRYGRTLKNRGEALVTVSTGALLGKKYDSVVGAFWSRSNSKQNSANATRCHKAVSEEGDSQPIACYKARPLNGIWATAPYLHNGSVPNLWQLLHSEDRSPEFHVGSREFDPKHVGFSIMAGINTSRLDTSIEGNSNKGHSGPKQGRNLTPKQKWQLIEFLKTL